MYIRLCRRCWCMAGLIPRFFELRVMVVYSLFIASHDTVPFYCWSSCTHEQRRRPTSLGFKSYGTQFLCFWIISNAFKRFETVVWLTSNNSTSSASVWHVSSSSNASGSPSSNVFGVPERYLSSRSKSLFLKCLNQSLHVVFDRAWSP